MSFCADCVKGFLHEGVPTGKWEEINTISCYVAVPEDGEYAKDTAILYLADIYGPQLLNSQLLSDDIARNGYKVVAVDFFDGDVAPDETLNPGSTWSIGEWFPKHGAAQSRPPLDKVIAGLKEQGVTKFGATGYCFGARYVFDLAFDNLINVAVANHPSLLKVPADLEKYAQVSKAALLLNTCTYDSQFPHEAQAKADEIFKDFAPGYKREYFEGYTHGFAVRGDLKDAKVVEGRDGAYRAAVTFFKNHL